MTVNTAPLTNRFEGRLFAEEGRLYFVVEVDSAQGIARVSCRIDGERQVVEMPLSEVGARLSSGADLQFGSLNGAHAARIKEKDDGWYFDTRDGLKGPYPTDDAAGEALTQYIASVTSK